jgi:hypothetical protein
MQQAPRGLADKLIDEAIAEQHEASKPKERMRPIQVFLPVEMLHDLDQDHWGE